MPQFPARLQKLLGPAYELERELTGAGMSRVFVAREVALDRRVVVKVLPPELITDSALARFRREIQLTARLQHPHILPVISTGGEGEIVYYVSPYVESESLRRFLATGHHLSLDEAISITLELLSAVAHAHARGIIHRDIKPGNILLSGRHAILADFGIARALEEDDDGRNVGSSIVHSPAYFAPEHPRDECADLWAIAVLMHESITGAVPVLPVTADALLESWSAIDRTIDIGRAQLAARVVARALDVDQGCRYPTAESFAQALREVARTTGTMPAIPAVPATPAVHHGQMSGDRRARRRRNIGILAGLGFLAAAGIGVAIAARAPQHAVTTTRARVLRMRSFQGTDSASRAAASRLTQLVAAGLAGVRGVVVVRDEVVSAGVSDAWKTLDARVVSTGRDLDAQVQLGNTAGDSLYTASVSGSRDSLPALADRIVIELLPQLYPGLRQRPGIAALRGTTSPAALREFLDGEVALQRGASDSAHVFFRTATEADPRYAIAWYRRAVAAERTVRVLDADSSAARALALATTLPVRERLLVEGYSAFRAGDMRKADELYQRVIQGDWHDIEAWVQLGELNYHSGPLLGRPIESSRDGWDRVLSVDSTDPTALMHALRLAARRGDLPAVRALDRRLGAESNANVPVVESHVIAAYATRDSAAMRNAQRALDTLPDNSVYFLHSMVAGLLERPAEAIPIARRQAAPDKPAAVRAQAYVTLAHIAMARGRPREAWRMLDTAATIDPWYAAVGRASLAALPFVQLPQPMLDVAASALGEAPAHAQGTPLYLELVADVPALPVIVPYLQQMIALGGANAVSAKRAALPCGSSSDAIVRDLCLDMQLGIDAERAKRGGANLPALKLLERMNMTVPYQLAGRSSFFARTRERWRRAELLEAEGAYTEAESWFAAASQPSRLDYVYLAPSWIHLARLAERAGRRVDALAYYRRAGDLLAEAEPEFVAMREEARAGVKRLER